MASVDPTKLYVSKVRRVYAVALADIWVASGLPGDVVDLVFKCVARSCESGHARIQPMGTAEFLKGYLALATRNLIWDETMEVTPTYCLRQVSAIIADDKVIEDERPSGPRVEDITKSLAVLR